MVAIPSDQGLDFVIPVGHDVHLGGFAVLAQCPLHIVRHRQSATPGGVVPQPQPLQLDRLSPVLIHWNEDRQLLLDPLTVMLEDRVPRPMPCPISGLFADRRRGRRPVDTGLLVPDVHRLRRWIHDGVVRPLRQAIALAVAIPGKARPRFADQCAEGGVGDDVHPGCRRVGVGAEIDRVFTPIRGKTAQAVEVGQLHEGQRSRRLPGSTFLGHGFRQIGNLHRHALE